MNRRGGPPPLTNTGGFESPHRPETPPRPEDGSQNHQSRGALAATGSSSLTSGVAGGLLAGLVGLAIFVFLAEVEPGLNQEGRLTVLASLIPALVTLVVLGWSELAVGNVRAALVQAGRPVVLAVAGGLNGLIISDWIFQNAGGPSGSSDWWDRWIVVIGFAIVAGTVGFATGLDKSLRRGVVGLLGGLAGGALAGLLILVFGGTRDMETRALLAAVPTGTVVLGAAIGGADRLGRTTWVEVVDGPMAGRQINLYANPAVIGASPSADVVLTGPEVLAQHASIVRHGEEIWIDSLDPGARTRVNRVHLEDRLPVGPDDLIQIGDSYLRFHTR